MNLVQVKTNIHDFERCEGRNSFHTRLSDREIHSPGEGGGGGGISASAFDQESEA